jgi:hypothetical protein
MPAANDRLVRVVCVQVQPATAEDHCKDVARCGNTLPGGTTYTNGKGLTHKIPFQLKQPELVSLNSFEW